MTVITALTKAQRCRISEFRDKWWAIAHRPGSSDEAVMRNTIARVYELSKRPTPKVIIVDSPLVAIALAQSHLFDAKTISEQFIDPGWAKCRNLIWSNLLTQLSPEVNRELWSQFETLASSGLWSWLAKELNRDRDIKSVSISDILRLEEMTAWAAQIDFCQTVLGCIIDSNLWTILSQTVHHCYWTIATADLCIASKRPTAQRFDKQGLPHANGEPAIAFANNTGIYSYHGIRLPETYGQVPIALWQSQWLLNESSATFRHILIQEIGYSRICEELSATVLDVWQDYSLLKLDALNQVHPNITMCLVPFSDEEQESFAANHGFHIEKNKFGDTRLVRPSSVEEFYVLKMLCPITKRLHAIRVPSTIQTVREAVRWVHWNIDPEEL